MSALRILLERVLCFAFGQHELGWIDSGGNGKPLVSFPVCVRCGVRLLLAVCCVTISWACR